MTIDSLSEEYFPRGGHAKEIKKKRNFVFESKSSNEPKAKKPGKRERQRDAKLYQNEEEDDEVENEPIFFTFERLTKQKLSVGTVALCSVREVNENCVDISMPGRLSAKLYIDNISQPYDKIRNTARSTEDEEMAESLDRLFRVGQHLSCSVLSVTTVGQACVRLTSDPAIINSRLTFPSVTIGMILQMAVQSLEDNGYMMFSGIPGLVAFLPYATTPKPFLIQKKAFFIGQVVWCLVTKSNLTSSSNTIQVTVDSNEIDNSKLESDITMEQLTPGVNVNVVITKVTSQALLATIQGSDVHGYIEDSQLSTPWSQISDYTVGSRHPATVLYRVPYARVIALTLKSGPTSSSIMEIEIGTIFPNAEVMGILKRGVCLKLNHNGKSLKGMVSTRRLGEDVDNVSFSTRFPIGNHITCRVIGFDALEQVYSCSTEDKVLNEKYLTSADLKVGESVEVVVESLKKRGLVVSIGMVKGYVPAVHITDVLLQNPFEKIRLKSKYKGKVLKIDNHGVMITLRPTLVKTPSLTRFEDVEVGEGYFGVVGNIAADSILVSFFGETYAWINSQNLLEPAHKYTPGELVKCYVVRKRFEKSPILSLSKSVQNMTLTVGNKYDLIVKELSPQGLKCFFMSQGQQFNGFLPLEHFSDYPEYCEREMKKYPHGSKISNVILLSINDKLPLFTLRRSVMDFYQEFPQVCEGLRLLTKETFIPCSVSEITPEGILVNAPIPGYNGKILIESKNLPAPLSSYSEYQGVVAKVKKVNNKLSLVELTCRYSDPYKLQFVSRYIVNLLEYQKREEEHRPGKTVRCLVQEVNENSARVSILSTQTPATLVSSHPETLKVGDKLKALVLFHDPDSGAVYLYREKASISLLDAEGNSLENTVVPGTVLHSGIQFTLALVNTSGARRSLAFIPNAVDINSPRPDKSVQESGQFTNSHYRLRSLHERKYDDVSIYYWIGTALFSGSCKRKMEDSEGDISSAESSGASGKKLKSNTTDSKKKVKRLSTQDSSEEVEQKKKSKKSEDGEAIESLEKEGDSVDLMMEAAASFQWDPTSADLTNAIVPDTHQLEQDDSEDEVVVERKATAREKRLAAAEREREIREKEEELLLSESKPESAEHFDRLLTATPNSSRLWIMYMAHHLQGTEIEKARSVAKRALKHINVRLEDEILNVWIASLNLENIYGTHETFKEVLTEALKYNDDYKVQARVLDLYAESGKVEELEKLALQLVKKYRSRVECWLACQEALMKANLPDKARNFLQRSLEALPNKEYCSLISRFALVENKYGFREEAQSLFENLLTSYPKRIDLWFVYVDMLTKSGSQDLARNVLERATSQKLPVRKMKSLYQKWLKLEETYGTPESAEEVKSAAEAYISNLTAALSSHD